MNKDKTIVLVLLTILIAMSVILISLVACGGPKAEQIEETALTATDPAITEHERYKMLAESDGYDDIEEWAKHLQEIKDEFEGSAQEAYDMYGEFLSDEQNSFLFEYEENIMKAETITELAQWRQWFDNIVAIGEEAKAEADAWWAEQASYNYNYGYSSYNTPTSGLTPSGGVNYYDGRKETYYSSNVAYHYRTNEWTLDDEGFYRTDEGYYVVAASDMEQGTTFEGSKGTCIVLDSGCAEGVTDYYVGW